MNTNIVTQRPAMVDAPPHVLARIMTVLMAAALAGGLLTTDAQARGGGGHGGGGFGGGFAGGHGGGFVGGGLLPLAPALGSTGSAAVGTALFVGSPATIVGGFAGGHGGGFVGGFGGGFAGADVAGRGPPSNRTAAVSRAFWAAEEARVNAISRAFWAAEEARVKAITNRIEAKWRQMASR